MKSYSIAMAAYNGEKYIGEQIDSLLKQTVPFSELVICDDCSKDNTFKVLEEYAKKDSRIKVYENESNLGFKKNFEKAARLCTSEYIALSDQDDIWVPEHMELLFKEMDEKNCVVACGNSFAADGDCKPIGRKCKPDTYYLSQDRDEQFLQILYSIPVQGCTAVFHKNLLEKFLPIPETQKFHDQWLALAAVTEGKISFVQDGLLYYRTHASNVTGGYEAGFKGKLKHLLHEKDDQFLLDQIKYNSDLNRFNLTEKQKDILEQSMQFLKTMTKKHGRFKALPYFNKYYKLIYTTNTNKYKLPRFFVKFILCR